MRKILILVLKTNNVNSLFCELSQAEIETIYGGSGGSVNNYLITSNTGDTTVGSSPTVETGTIHDNKIGTVDMSRSTNIWINSW